MRRVGTPLWEKLKAAGKAEREKQLIAQGISPQELQATTEALKNTKRGTIPPAHLQAPQISTPPLQKKEKP